MDTGVATMEAENNEVLNSSGSKEETLGCSAFCGRDASALESSLQLAAPRDGAPAPSLRSLPNAAKGDRDGCRSPRRGQDGQRATMCQIYGVLQSARKTADTTRHGSGPCFIAWHSGAIGASDREETLDGTHRKGTKCRINSPVDDDDNVQKQIRDAVKQAFRAK